MKQNKTFAYKKNIKLKLYLFTFCYRLLCLYVYRQISKKRTIKKIKSGKVVKKRQEILNNKTIQTKRILSLSGTTLKLKFFY